MDKDLNSIIKKIDSIQFGLLRFNDRKKQLTLQVKATTNGDDTSLNCMITDDVNHPKLINKNIHLIQKYNEDYLYTTGKVIMEGQSNNRVLFVRIVKAHWFVRKSRGNVSWLQEKLMYAPTEKIAS
jgi:hypothetical protein